MKMCIFKISESAIVLWLPRSYYDSKVAIQVESIGTGYDKNTIVSH